MRSMKFVHVTRMFAVALFVVLSLVAQRGGAQVQFVPTLATVVGGGTGTCATATDSYGDGCTGLNAVLSSVRQMAVDAKGNVYFTDSGHNLVRVWNPNTGVVNVVAGGASTVCAAATDAFGDGCPGTQSTLNNARGMAVDGAGNVYIADGGNNLVRVVSASTGIITVFAGGNAVRCEAGCGGRWVSCGTNDGERTELRGCGFAGERVHPGLPEWKDDRAEGDGVYGLVSIVAGKYGSSCSSAGVCGDGGPATSGTLNQAYGVAVDAWGNIYIADDKDYRVRMVTASTGIISTIAGVVGDTSTSTSSGNGGPATAAHTLSLYNLSTDAAGNV